MEMVRQKEVYVAIKGQHKPSVEAHASNPSTWENDTRGSLVQDQPGLHSKTLSQKQQNKIQKSNVRGPVVMGVLGTLTV
jgi:hypothetical protein